MDRLAGLRHEEGPPMFSTEEKEEVLDTSKSVIQINNTSALCKCKQMKFEMEDIKSYNINLSGIQFKKFIPLDLVNILITEIESTNCALKADCTPFGKHRGQTAREESIKTRKMWKLKCFLSKLFSPKARA